MSNKNSLLEKIDEKQNTNLVKIEEKQDENSATTFVPVKEKSTDVISIFTLLVILFIVVIFLVFSIFTVYNILNTNIISGVSIKGIDVSGLSTSDARYQLDNYLKDRLPEEIKLTYKDFETTISLSQMDIAFDTKSACNSAFHIGRNGSIFENNLSVLSTMFGNINIEPNVTFNKELLKKNLEDISAQLPDTVIQSSYYIENDELIITAGTEGNVVNVDATIESIKNAISTFSALDTPIEITVKTQQPEEIDVEAIYNEVRKDPVDAYYTTDPFAVYPSENGVDFKISLEDAKALVASEQKEEYNIPLNIIIPNVTTNMIGTEAFPDLLSTYSTKYATSNKIEQQIWF